MAQTKKDRWVKVEVKNASGRKVQKWKDTTTGKTYFSKPLRDPTKTSATGRFGVNKLTNDPKLNKSIKASQKKDGKDHENLIKNQLVKDLQVES